MKTPIELLIELYNMYDAGELASEFDKKRNKMVNSAQLESIMREVEPFVPMKLEPVQAASTMRAMEQTERDEAIKASEGKVIDMRKLFQMKMSENGGALGLTKQLIEAINTNETGRAAEILMDMEELVKQSD